jgi:sugar lactone lactonase YvrE
MRHRPRHPRPRRLGPVLALAALAGIAATAAAVVPSDPIDRIVGTGVAGGDGDGGPAIDAQLDAPQGIAVDGAGRIYIADGNNGRIRVVDPDGRIRSTGGSFGEPSDVAVDAAGNIYVAGASDAAVFRITPSGVRSTFAGTGVTGTSADGLAADASQLDDPRGVAVDGAGNVYIAESGNDRVRRVGPDGILRTAAGSFAGGFFGDGGLAINAQLSGPRDVAVGPDGSLAIADSGNNRVRVVDPNGVIRTIAGTGATSGPVCPVGPSDGPGNPLDFPARVAVDGSGNVYVGSQGCVTKVAGGLIRRIAGNGTTATDGGDGGPASGALIAPSGLAVDPGGSLLIADGLASKVRKVTNAPPAAAFSTATPAQLILDVDATASSSGQAGEGLVAYAWTFGDGATASGATARHTYAGGGTYTVTLTVRDDSGAVAVASRAVAVAGPPPPPRVTVTRTRLVGAYRGGRLRASLAITGITTGPGQVAVSLVRRSGPAAVGLLRSATLSLRLTRAGAVSQRVALPRTLAPGTYAIAVGGTAVAGRPGRVVIASPRQGILRRAFVSSLPNGPAATVFPPTTRQLYCNFEMAVLPAKGRANVLSTTWRVPGRTLGRVSKPRTRRVSGVVARSGARFPAGRYTCTLRSGPRVVGSVAARIR